MLPRLQAVPADDDRIHLCSNGQQQQLVEQPRQSLHASSCSGVARSVMVVVKRLVIKLLLLPTIVVDVLRVTMSRGAGTSLCICLYTQNIHKRQVHFQSLDGKWICLSITVSRTAGFTGEVPALFENTVRGARVL